MNKQIKYVYTKMLFAFVLKSKDDSTYAVRYKEFFLDIIDFRKKKN